MEDFVSYKHRIFMLIIGLESCLLTYYDGTHSMQSEQMMSMLNFSKSVPMKKQTHYTLHSLRVSTFSANFHFLVNCFYNALKG